MSKKWIILWIIFILFIITIKIISYIDEKNNTHIIDYDNYANIIKQDYKYLSDKVTCKENNICYLYMQDIMETLYDLVDKNESNKDDLTLFSPPIDSNLNECYGYFIINNNQDEINIDATHMCDLT